MKTKAKPANPPSPTGPPSAGANRKSWTAKPAPTPTEKQETEYRLCLAKLGISPQTLSRAAPLTKILAEADGGIPAILETMRFAGDVPVIAKFLAVYDRSTAFDRDRLPLEAFALLGDIPIPELLGEILLALQRSSANLVKVIAFSNHPKTVQARVASALIPGPDGRADRDALDKALRFLPQSKGMTIVLPPELHPGQGVSPDDVDTDQIFPDLKETQRLLSDGDD